ncbi:unnamed protein product [Cochlearia groenlandica]
MGGKDYDRTIREPRVEYRGDDSRYKELNDKFDNVLQAVDGAYVELNAKYDRLASHVKILDHQSAQVASCSKGSTVNLPGKTIANRNKFCNVILNIKREDSVEGGSVINEGEGEPFFPKYQRNVLSRLSENFSRQGITIPYLHHVDQVSAYVDPLSKNQDPGAFIISAILGRLRVNNAMIDIESSVNVISHKIIPTDFVVIKGSNDCNEVSLILGRPFLETVGERIAYEIGRMILLNVDERVYYSIGSSRKVLCGMITTKEGGRNIKNEEDPSMERLKMKFKEWNLGDKVEHPQAKMIKG